MFMIKREKLTDGTVANKNTADTISNVPEKGHEVKF
jgi:hypothetical protein